MEDRFATLMYTHSHAEVYDDGNRSLGKGCHLALNELERFRFLVSDLQPEVMGKSSRARDALSCASVQQGEECVCGGGWGEYLEDPLSLASAHRILNGQVSFRDRMEGGQEKPMV